MLRFVFLVLKPNFFLLNCLIMLFKTKVAYNGQGLAMLGQLRFVTLELKLNIVTNVDCDYKR
jgi:hypothetical protein